MFLALQDVIETFIDVLLQGSWGSSQERRKDEWWTNGLGMSIKRWTCFLLLHKNEGN